MKENRIQELKEVKAEKLGNVSDYTKTKDYKMHKVMSQEFESYEVSLRVLNRSRALPKYIGTLYTKSDIKYEIECVNKGIKRVKEFVQDYTCYTQSKLIRHETLSNLKLIEENIRITAEYFDIDLDGSKDKKALTFTKDTQNGLEISIDEKQVVENISRGFKEIVGLVKKTPDDKISKGRISRYRNSVRQLFDALKRNEGRMTSEQSSAIKAQFKLVEDEHSIVLHKLKDEDVRSWNSLIEKLDKYLLLDK